MSRVIVIEDNDDLREIVQLILDGAGYRTEAVADGKSGIDAQRREPAALVITDIFMPEQDGIETIAALHAEFPDLKVIAVSGGGKASSADGYLRTALAIGADAVLSKPFDQHELLATVRDLLGPPAGA